MGEMEIDYCYICKKLRPVRRKYYSYNIKCECCGGNDGKHFELVKHCADCKPIPPLEIRPHIKGINYLEVEENDK